MEIRKMCMRILEVELNRPGCLRKTAAHFGKQVFETAWQIDANPMGLARHRIQDGFPTALDQTLNTDLRLSLIDINLKVDFGKHRIVDLGKRGGKDLKDRGAGIGILPAHNPKQSVSLFFAGPLVDDRYNLASAKVDRARPGHCGGKLQTAEAGLAMLSFQDLSCHYGFAFPVCGKAVELTRATVGAITMKELAPFNRPFQMSHALLLSNRIQ